MSIIEQLAGRWKSGNAIDVERIHITRTEFDALKGADADMRAKLREAIANHDDATLLSEKVAELRSDIERLTAIVNAPRGTDTQIEKERSIAAASIYGAVSKGMEGEECPDGHWLSGAHEAGECIAELRARVRVLEEEARLTTSPAMQLFAQQSCDMSDALFAARVDGLGGNVEAVKRLIAERDQLRSEVVDLRKDHANVCAMAKDISHSKDRQIAELQAELEKERTDSARYRWLRDSGMRGWWTVLVCDKSGMTRCIGSRILDASLDAAMIAAPSPKDSSND